QVGVEGHQAFCHQLPFRPHHLNGVAGLEAAFHCPHPCGEEALVAMRHRTAGTLIDNDASPSRRSPRYPELSSRLAGSAGWKICSHVPALPDIDEGSGAIPEGDD